MNKVFLGTSPEYGGGGQRKRKFFLALIHFLSPTVKGGQRSECSLEAFPNGVCAPPLGTKTKIPGEETPIRATTALKRKRGADGSARAVKCI